MDGGGGLERGELIDKFLCSDLESIKATLDETVSQTVEQLLEPSKNGLIPKSD